MQRYNQRMIEQLKARQQQEKARLPKIQRSEGKTRMAMYKKSLHISGAGSAAEQREKIKQVGLRWRRVPGLSLRPLGTSNVRCHTGLGRRSASPSQKPNGDLAPGGHRKAGGAFSRPVPLRTPVCLSCSVLCCSAPSSHHRDPTRMPLPWLGDTDSAALGSRDSCMVHMLS